MSNSANELMILPSTKRRRRDSDNQDRSSDLPDDVILHILSFLNTKEAVQTCLLLSPRWKCLWKTIFPLILHSSDFCTKKHFATFVSKILTLRDTKTALHALDLHRPGNIEPHLLKKVLNYVDSHNTQIQQLAINFIADSYPILSCVSKCRALTSLKLHVSNKSLDSVGETLFPESLNLPSLTSLDLAYFIFCASDNADRAEPFLAFSSLHSLTIAYCTIRDAPILSISNGTLVNLTMNNNSYAFTKIELFTPSLYTFSFYGTHYYPLCGSGLSSVKQIDIDVPMSPRFEIILSWLQDFANVKSLTINITTLKILSEVPDLFKDKPHFLCNLESLKVRAATIPKRIIDFLRQNLPNAKVDMIDHRT
ncbi:F-box family protein [Trifolium medium]|uniref:F-box family protein n=1 Tax=Trifolium medium TaxID=97028 RepID=A0A392M8B2_9FABA|nr:F-box family protein [Trifolium medium]